MIARRQPHPTGHRRPPKQSGGLPGPLSVRVKMRLYFPWNVLREGLKTRASIGQLKGDRYARCNSSPDL